MYYVYLLKSLKDNKYYIGCSGDLRRRFREHAEGLVTATRSRRPLKLVYYEAYDTKDLATDRERQLKKFGSAYQGLIKRLQ